MVYISLTTVAVLVVVLRCQSHAARAIVQHPPPSAADELQRNVENGLEYSTPPDVEQDDDGVLGDFNDVAKPAVPLVPNNLHGFGNSEGDVRFFCVRSRSSSLVQVFQNDVNLTAKLDVTKPLAFVVHGWMDRFFSTFLYHDGLGWPVATVLDWVNFVDTNVCGVDWAPLSNVNYIQAALKNTHTTAYWLSRFVLQVQRAGIAFANVTIAGHSLGAQIAGFTGKNVQLWASGQLGTIYGLDPAGPLFTFPLMAPPQNILQPGDAGWVQVIHTSAFTFGVALGSHTGDESFAPNGGVYQPGCVISTLTTTDTKPFMCSHFRSVQYFRSALNPAHRFVGESCQTRAGGLLGLLGMWKKECSAPVEDLLGIWSRRVPGRFSLKTTKTWPFCLGCTQ